MKLFDSELKIMEILWREGDISAKRIAEIAKEQIGWSKTTTYTNIKRCIDKGAVERYQEQVSNHHFKWWLDISPIRALLLAHLKGGYRKHYYHLPLKEAIS